MAINVDRELDVIKSFKRQKIIVNILQYVIGASVGFAIFALTHRNPTLTGFPYTTEVIIGAIVFAAALVAFFLTWKCPACKKFLGISTRITACRKCHTVFEGKESTSGGIDYCSMYRKRRKIVWLMGIPILIGFILVFILEKFGDIFLIIPIILWVPSFITIFINWRCPKCNKYLMERINPQRCPYCDERLHW
jgi:hypothetical protein